MIKKNLLDLDCPRPVQYSQFSIICSGFYSLCCARVFRRRRTNVFTALVARCLQSCPGLLNTQNNWNSKNSWEFNEFSLNWPTWADSVIESPWLCGSLVVRHRMQFFLGLSLALTSHDQFQASHWSSPAPIFKDI